MNILGIDTSTETLTTALLYDDQPAIISRRAGTRHAELLLPQIDTLLSLPGIGGGELDLLVCAEGPGSFTGLRIAMSTAKGLSEGFGIPLVTVPTLDCLAYPFSALPVTVVPVIDARKKRFYAALYRRGERCSDYLDIGPEELLSQCRNEGVTFFTGPGAALLSEQSPPSDSVIFNRAGLALSGQALLALGLRRYREAGAASPETGPRYLRLSEAELGGAASK